MKSCWAPSAGYQGLLIVVHVLACLLSLESAHMLRAAQERRGTGLNLSSLLCAQSCLSLQPYHLSSARSHSLAALNEAYSTGYRQALNVCWNELLYTEVGAEVDSIAVEMQSKSAKPHADVYRSAELMWLMLPTTRREGALTRQTWWCAYLH